MYRVYILADVLFKLSNIGNIENFEATYHAIITY